MSAADIAAAGDHGYHHRTPPPQGATPGNGDSEGGREGGREAGGRGEGEDKVAREEMGK